MTVHHLVDPEDPLAMYGGVSASMKYIGDDKSSLFGILLRVVDFPFTAVADTLLLPVSGLVELSRGS